MRTNWITKLAVGIGVAAAATPGAISLAGSATPTPLSAAQKIALAKQAYPTLTSASDTAAPMDKTAVARATLGGDWVLTATSSGDVCLSSTDSSSCVPGDEAAVHGVFLATVDCSANVAHLTGVLPAGARRVTAGSTAASASATGRASLDVPGASFPSLKLDNGQMNPLSLKNVCGPRPSSS